MTRLNRYSLQTLDVADLGQMPRHRASQSICGRHQLLRPSGKVHSKSPSPALADSGSIGMHQFCTQSSIWLIDTAAGIGNWLDMSAAPCLRASFWITMLG